ncbi:MAG: glucose-6-phosphate dehydrogenase [Candidatus Eisenbacteria bacterium]|nr:glucose-6-phosphate dehydrogenase [Candidatus Eisenbacteria bacterium]
MTTRIEVPIGLPHPQQQPEAPPCITVVFGATGDLTRRKLMPALYNLAAGGHVRDRFAAVGCARRPWTREEFAAQVKAGVSEFSRNELEPRVWEWLEPRLDYVSGDFKDPATFQRLKAALEELDEKLGTAGNRLFYLAVSPDEFGTILRGLRDAGLIVAPGAPTFSRVIVEKPFGRSLETARQLNGLVAEVLDESQTFRIDHYLGKETVQNIMVFRFANSMFEPLWNRKYIDHVQITAAETVGVGSRGKFYESTGVLRDIVQNHLLEVLTLCAMEPPNSGDADDVRGEKLKVLQALRMPWADTVPNDVVLGQYRGYRDEPDVAPDSVAPTFVALPVYVDNWRWQGVPFYLRAGKKMARRVTEVAFHMQPIPLSLFGNGDLCEHVEPNVLTLRIQPEEGITLSFSSKMPGHDFTVTPVVMDMKYTEAFGGEPPEAYERLLLDAMRGDATLFSRRDAVETSWQWIQPILDYWDSHPPRDLPNYDPGSWGPEAADRLIQRDRRQWRNP